MKCLAEIKQRSIGVPIAKKHATPEQGEEKVRKKRSLKCNKSVQVIMMIVQQKRVLSF